MLWLIVAAALEAAVPAPEAPSAPPNCPPKTGPDWWRLAMKSSDYLGAYPPRALRNNIAGLAIINCRAEPDTTLGDCKVDSEAPAGEGFGTAALKLAHFFRVRPPCPYNEAHVDIPIRFNLPGG